MLSKIIVFGCSCSFFASVYFLRNEKKYGIILNNLDKVQMVDFDRIIDYNQIPPQKLIAI